MKIDIRDTTSDVDGEDNAVKTGDELEESSEEDDL